MEAGDPQSLRKPHEHLMHAGGISQLSLVVQNERGTLFLREARMDRRGLGLPTPTGHPRESGDVESRLKCNTWDRASAGVRKSRHLRGV